MAQEPFLPLFFGDFLASTAEWEGEERALYLLLMCYQWSLGSLPLEPRRVCKLVGWDWQVFERCWVTVGAKFQANAGRLLNQRLEQHRAKSHEISQKRAAAGAEGGRIAQANARAARGQLLNSEKANASILLDPPSHPIPSHPNPTQIRENQDTTAAARPTRTKVSRETVSEWWLDFKLAYPSRAGGQPWRRAEKAANARIAEGHSIAELIAGARRYAAFIEATGKSETEYVQQAATFLGPDKHFLLPWHPPPKAESATERLLRNLNTDDRVIEHESDPAEPRAITHG